MANLAPIINPDQPGWVEEIIAVNLDRAGFSKSKGQQGDSLAIGTVAHSRSGNFQFVNLSASAAASLPPGLDQASAPAKQSCVDETLTKVYEKSCAGAEPEALKFLFSTIETAFEQEDLVFVDSLLAKFEPKQVNRMVAVGMVRCTFRARKLLESWKACLDRVAESLLERGEPAAHILRGLYR